jgi:fermentation-respiration switch protein FrsA (DUF1100 family)
MGCDSLLRFIGIWCFELLWCLADLIIKPRMLSYEKGFQREVNCNKFDLKTYRSMEKQAFHIKSDYGYILSCELVEAPERKEKKIVILCHGLGYAKYGSIKYMEMFLRLGFSVLMYDHRNHGQSGKAFTSMGFYEKYDLKRVVDWCYGRYGDECRVITHGESMGASTVLLHLGIDDRVKCAIADCAYSDLVILLRHQLKQYYHLPCFLIPYVSCLTYLRAGFWYGEVSPIRTICGVDTPVLFIHGKRDNFVPTEMSRRMYECKKRNKAIYLVAKARHAESYCKNKDGYEKRVAEFLKTYMG